MTTSNYIPIVDLSFLYINGLQLKNNTGTPNTKLDIALGQCRDSTNSFDISLAASVTINAAINGINGLDTGTFAASTVYAVYVISDPVTGLATGALLSLSATAPLLPFGYSAFRLIGYAVSDASTHFLLGYWTAGNTGSRSFTYDAPQATAVTAGNATSYTAVDLSAVIPLIDQEPVSIAYAYTPATAGNTLKLQGANSTGDAVTITGQVTTVIISSNIQVLAQTKSSKPEINYKVSNGSDAVALKVAGYSLSL